MHVRRVTAAPPARASEGVLRTNCGAKPRPGRFYCKADELTRPARRCARARRIDGDRGAARRVARHRGGRVLRAARPERRRQVDADPLHDRPGAADRRVDRGLRPRRDRPLRAGAARRRARAAGAQPRLVPHLSRRRSTTTAATSGCRAEGAQGAHAELLDAFSLDREAHERTRTLSGGMKRRLILARALMHRPAAADPRRADRRRRRGAAPRAVAVRAAHQRGGHDDPADDALPRGGRAAVRPDRLHQRRRDRRPGHERGARRAVRRHIARGRLPRARRPQGALARARPGGRGS